MNISYISYGFSRLIISILLGVFLGSLLILFNFNEEKAFDFALIFVYFLLIVSGYSFAKNAEEDRYKNSFSLSIVLTSSFLLFYSLLQSFDPFFIIKNFFILIFFLGFGIMCNYFKFKKNMV